MDKTMDKTMDKMTDKMTDKTNDNPIELFTRFKILKLYRKKDLIVFNFPEDDVVEIRKNEVVILINKLLDSGCDTLEWRYNHSLISNFITINDVLTTYQII